MSANAPRGFSSRLSWTHYRTLTKVDDPAARAFYEIEAEREGWSVPHLERQIHTQLFARLLKSRDKAGLMDLAKRGQAIERPIDLMKSPVVLFDAQGRTEGDGPTIGLILCAEKNEAIAKYSILHEHEQLFAAKYVTYLPSVEELERELRRDRRLAEEIADTPPSTRATEGRRSRRAKGQK